MERRGQRLPLALAASLAVSMLAGISCHDTSGPRPGPLPVLSRHTDTVTAIGDTVRLTVVGSSSDLVWETRDQRVAMVTQTGRVTGLTAGETWVLVFRNPAFADSTRLVVHQRVDSIVLTPSTMSRPLNRTQQFQAVPLDAHGAPVPNVAAQWSVSGDAATIDGGGLATAVAVGTATIRVTINGTSSSATLTVTALPALRTTLDTIDIGVGQYANGNLPPIRVIADSITPDESFTASLSLSDPSVASLSVQTLAVPETQGSKTSPAFQIMGLAPGITKLTASGGQYTNGTAVVRVSTPRLQLTGPDIWPANVPFTYSMFAVGIADSLGVRHGVVQPLPIRIRTTTAGVLSPVDTTLTMPELGGVLSLPIQRGTSGQTWIVASAPGYRSDSLLVSVSAAKLRFTQYDGVEVSSASVGAGELYNPGALFVYAACCQFTDLPITITQRHPEALRVLHSLLLPAMDQDGHLQLQPTGLAPATDILIATAPGFLPDTLIFRVTTPTYALAGYPRTRTVGAPFIVTAYVADSLGTISFPATGLAKVLVRSSDPAILHPSSDTLVIGNTTDGGSLRIDVVGPGTATLTLSDPLGVFAPTMTAPIVVAPTKLLVTSGSPPSSASSSVGMHQLSGGSVQIANYGSIADSIRLRTTDPTIAQPNVSAVASHPNGTSFRITGGERAGTAWIVASAPGLISDSLPVSVGKPAISVFVQSTTATAAQTGTLSLQLLDQTGAVRATSETVTFRIVSSDPRVVTADSTITVPAGQIQSGPATVHFVGAGTAVLRVVDDRNVPYAYEPGASAIIQVSAPKSP